MQILSLTQNAFYLTLYKDVDSVLQLLAFWYLQTKLEVTVKTEIDPTRTASSAEIVIQSVDV
jgi:hypothetical protein